MSCIDNIQKVQECNLSLSLTFYRHWWVRCGVSGAFGRNMGDQCSWHMGLRTNRCACCYMLGHNLSLCFYLDQTQTWMCRSRISHQSCYSYTTCSCCWQGTSNDAFVWEDLQLTAPVPVYARATFHIPELAHYNNCTHMCFCFCYRFKDSGCSFWYKKSVTCKLDQYELCCAAQQYSKQQTNIAQGFA